MTPNSPEVAPDTDTGWPGTTVNPLRAAHIVNAVTTKSESRSHLNLGRLEGDGKGGDGIIAAPGEC